MISFCIQCHSESAVRLEIESDHWLIQCVHVVCSWSIRIDRSNNEFQEYRDCRYCRCHRVMSHCHSVHSPDQCIYCDVCGAHLNRKVRRTERWWGLQTLLNGDSRITAGCSQRKPLPGKRVNFEKMSSSLKCWSWPQSQQQPSCSKLSIKLVSTHQSHRKNE